MENASNPSALLLTRQKLPKLNLDQNYIEQGVKHGAYIIHKEDNPDAVLFASGSEVHLAIESVQGSQL
jgi:transketolase